MLQPQKFQMQIILIFVIGILPLDKDQEMVKLHDVKHDTSVNTKDSRILYVITFTITAISTGMDSLTKMNFMIVNLPSFMQLLIIMLTIMLHRVTLEQDVKDIVDLKVDLVK